MTSVKKDVRKLLLLGTSGAGKSGMLKQLRLLHGNGYNDKARLTFKNQIYGQIITQIKLLITTFRVFQHSEPQIFANALSEKGITAAKFMDKLSNNSDLNQNVVANIKILWQENVIQRTFAIKQNTQIVDSSPHFFQAIDRIADTKYLPTDQDILLASNTTTTIGKESISIKDQEFEMYDIGGRRNMRGNWEELYDGTDAVLYMVSLNSYNEVLCEDSTTNAMIDSIKVFANVVNSTWFQDSVMNLVFTKKDLFVEKLKQYPLRDYFPDYKGDNSYDDAVSFIRDKFDEQNQAADVKQIYVHVMNVVDKVDFKNVFNDVHHRVVNANLQRGN